MRRDDLPTSPASLSAVAFAAGFLAGAGRRQAEAPARRRDLAAAVELVGRHGRQTVIARR